MVVAVETRKISVLLKVWTQSPHLFFNVVSRPVFFIILFRSLFLLEAEKGVPFFGQ